jgi:KDO2-lipid IV(A) lauroyltransferase
MRGNTKKIMLLHFIVYFVFRSFLLAIYLLPFRFVASFGTFLGKVYYHFDRSRHRCVNANISVVYGRNLDNKKRELLGRESCEQLAMYIFDLLKLHKIITPENYHNYIEITGSSHLMTSINKGKGTIAVIGHFGNFYLFRYLSYLSIPPMTAVIRELDNPYLERFLNSMFAKCDVIVERPDGAIHTMHQLLVKNAIAVTLADQKAGGNPRVGRHGIVVDFFGIPSQTHITAPLLARRTGASIVPLFVIRKGPGRYRIEINEPLKLVHTSNEASDLAKNTRKINQIFEDYITKYPDHWFWLHRRWKDISGLEDLYESSNPLQLVENFRRDQARNEIQGEGYSWI